MIPPAESFGKWPVNEEGFSDDVFGWEVAPVAGIEAVHGVVAHDDVIAFGNLDAVAFADEERHIAIHMAGVMVGSSGFFGVEGIDFFEVWRGTVETLAVDHKMPVSADFHVFTAEANEAFDVELIRRNVPKTGFTPFFGNAFRFEDNDLPARRRTEIVFDAVHKEMVAGLNFEPDEFFAATDRLALDQPGAFFEA